MAADHLSEAPSMVCKSCKRTWLSKASNTLFAEMASYSRISDKVCLELTKSTPVLHYHRRTLLLVHLNLFGKSTLCYMRESVLVILSNMVTNFAALHSGLLAVGHQTQMPAPICGARIIKDHKLKLCGR